MYSAETKHNVIINSRNHMNEQIRRMKKDEFTTPLFLLEQE